MYIAGSQTELGNPSLRFSDVPEVLWINYMHPPLQPSNPLLGAGLKAFSLFSSSLTLLSSSPSPESLWPVQAVVLIPSGICSLVPPNLFVLYL